MPLHAQMEITAKPAGGTDLVAVLQADINNLGGTDDILPMSRT